LAQISEAASVVLEAEPARAKTEAMMGEEALVPPTVCQPLLW
jgi:hypothetical protein